MTEVQIDKVIVAAVIEVRRELGGPGLIEDIEFNAKIAEAQRRNSDGEVAGLQMITIV